MAEFGQDEDDLNTKNNKNVCQKWCCDDCYSTLWGSRKRGKRKIAGFRKKLMILEAEI